MALYAGVMSGTSLDGADAVIAAIDANGNTKLLAHAHRPFGPELRALLIRLQSPGDDEIALASRASLSLAEIYVDAIEACAATLGQPTSALAGVGVHGQTIRHAPAAGYTVQINAPAVVAEALGCPVVADFRSRDIAAGGQGAPLVPAFHAAVFARDNEHVVVANIGGISNVTDLPEKGRTVRGWDCGPGNVLMDEWVSKHLGVAFDANGDFAATGQVSHDLLRALESEPWLSLPPPKSTGRDLFNPSWLAQRLSAVSGAIRPADVQATLCEFTARCIARSVTEHAGAPRRLIVCGGGRHNAELMRRLAKALPETTTQGSETYGIEANHVEALAFAWLAQRCLLGLAGNLPDVTGARGPRVLGAIYPA